jgi:hypothetical protein
VYIEVQHLGDVDGLLVVHNVPEAVAGQDDQAVLWQQQHLAHVRLAFKQPAGV